MAQQPPQHRRPRLFGPFFIIALIASVGVYFWQKQQTARRLDTLPPPVVEHRVLQGPSAEIGGPPPDFVLRSAGELKLTETQRRRVAELAADYERELAPLQQALEPATRRFGEYRQQSGGKQRVSMDELRQQMAEVSELSGRVSALRSRYWEETAPLLTARQQEQAREAWGTSLRPRLSPTSAEGKKQ